MVFFFLMCRRNIAKYYHNKLQLQWKCHKFVLTTFSGSRVSISRIKNRRSRAACVRRRRSSLQQFTDRRNRPVMCNIWRERSGQDGNHQIHFAIFVFCNQQRKHVGRTANTRSEHYFGIFRYVPARSIGLNSLPSRQGKVYSYVCPVKFNSLYYHINRIIYGFKEVVYVGKIDTITTNIVRCFERVKCTQV